MNNSQHEGILEILKTIGTQFDIMKVLLDTIGQQQKAFEHRFNERFNNIEHRYKK